MILVALLACHPKEKDSITDDPGGDTGRCSDTPELTAVVTDMPTVVRVTWRTDEPTDEVVLYGHAGEPEQVTEVSSGTEHEVLLTGLRALSDVYFHVESVDGETCGRGSVVSTGAFAPGLAVITSSADVPEAAEGGFTLVSTMTFDAAWIVAFDGAGEVVWALETTSEQGTPAPALRVVLSQDGKSVIYSTQAVSAETLGEIHRFGLDGEHLASVAAAGLHTDFVERGDGEYTGIGWEVREIEGGRKLLGDTLVEVDESGGATEVWNAFDWLDVYWDPTYVSGWYPADLEVEDWSHVNGLSWDEDDAAYYLSIGGLHAVGRVDRADGALAWYLDQREKEFDIRGRETVVAAPHSVQWLDGSLVIFNRGDTDDSEECSSADEVALDLEARTAENVWHYQSEACLLVPFLGEATRLAGGNTQVVWTTSGQIDEVTPEGELANRVNVPLGTAFGFAQRLTRLGPPSGR